VAWSTDEVVELLAACARSGLRVVRLKGGDPHVCSRGAEEALALAAAGLTVEVTPGVTSASAAGLAAGVARGAAVTVASGNHDPAGPAVDWPAVGATHGGLGSVVVLTGRAHQGRIAEGLLAGGLAAGREAAVVHAAGRPDEEVALADLASIGRVRLPAPAAMVVGPSPEGGPRAHP
jgi:siroheme synthase